MNNYEKEFGELKKVLETLRSENGCEWDKKQTFETLKPYITEESYEVVNAVDEKNYEELKKELGDVLFQVMFFSEIAEENGYFKIEDVIKNIKDKMIYRHPHVFRKDGEYSYQRWEELKSKEKNEKDYSLIGDFKKNIPPYINLRRLIENMTENNIDFYEKTDIKKDFNDAIDNKDFERLTELFFYFTVKNRINFDSAVNNAALKFYRRFTETEKEFSYDIKNKNFDIIENELLKRYQEEEK
ncbi:MAG TPA: MazG nucleotide pyrophosphohydrolase domain-containing protein [Tepiditoga sp.]|nr:MazG nucleotide pyrophosphohydrolase domain-containing protein [Tepiditoga sp.]